MNDRSYTIELSIPDDADDVDPEPLRRAVELTVRRCGKNACRMSIALIDDQAMASLHKTYMDEPGPTDVLSFDLRADDGPCPDGEIVISLTTARREASARGNTVAGEVALYAVHGTLHLLGYDDKTKAQAQRMYAMERQLLVELGHGAVRTRDRQRDGSPPMRLPGGAEHR